MDKKKKSGIIGIVILAIILIAFTVVILMPKKDKESNKTPEVTTSPLDVALLDPTIGYVTDPAIIEAIRAELGIYSDLDVEALVFKTVDEDNLYTSTQYNDTTVIGIHYCISTGETVCDIKVSESSMMPKPFDD